MNKPDLVDRIAEAFPELQEDLEEDAGFPHLQMGHLARIAQRAKGAGEWDRYERCTRVADDLWRDGDDELRNVVGVSFLEHLDFAGARGPEAWSHLSADLQRQWQALQAYRSKVADSKGI
jgi:hypothetical protein